MDAYEWFTPENTGEYEWFGQNEETYLALKNDKYNFVAAVIGPPGSNGGQFGWVRIDDTENSQSSPQSISPDARTIIEIDGLSVGPDFRKGVFQNHDFIVGNALKSLAIGDTYLVRLSFMIVSSVINNEISVELDIGGNVGRIQGSRPTLPKSAGIVEPVEIVFDVYALDTFQANGGLFFIKSNTAASIWGVSVKIEPGFHQ